MKNGKEENERTKIVGYSTPHSALDPEHTEHLFRDALSMDNLVIFSQGSALKPEVYRICFTGRVFFSLLSLLRKACSAQSG